MKKYNVAVCGGGFAGISAALAAAREGKKVVLYAPTFRDSKEANEEILKQFDTKKFTEALGEDYILFIKLHPQVHEKAFIENAVDVTDYDDVRKLALFCDILITDYSSICMDFSFLDKKTVFFADSCICHAPH